MIKIREVIKLLKKNGFYIVAQKGTHVKFRSESRTVTVPVHDGSSGTLPRKTLRRIEEQSGVMLSAK